MSQSRIDFQSADAARFNQLRDQWRSAAASCALSRAGLRIAGVLPTFLNREYGFAFPSDEDLAGAIGTRNPSTAKRGLISLEDARLIERQTMVKRDAKGEAIGRLRRIYLTLPEVKVHPIGEGAESEGAKGESSPDVKVQKRLGEGSPVCTNILDRVILDKESAYDRKDKLEGTYTRDRLAQPHPNGEASKPVGTHPQTDEAPKEKKAQPAFEPPVKAQEPASSPVPKQNPYEAAKNGGAAFAPSVQDEPSPSPPPALSVRWQDAKHPKGKQGQPLNRVPFPAPKSLDAAHAFFRKHHVPETEWARMLPDLMDGHFYEFDLEPWMDA